MSKTSFFYRWLWLCLFLGIVLTSLVLWPWGLTPWSAVLIALSFVCPAIIVWGAWTIGRDRRSKAKGTLSTTTTNQGSMP